MAGAGLKFSLQYPDDVEIFLPAGVVIRGRQAVGADAYITRDGLMAAQVSTFDMNALKDKCHG